MHLRFVLYLFLLSAISLSASAQQIISGNVVNESDEPVAAVAVGFKGHSGGTTTDQYGNFRLNRPMTGETNLILVFSHVAYKRKELHLSELFGPLEVVLEHNLSILDEVKVSGEGYTQEAGVHGIKKINFSEMPSPDSDFNTILKTIPGVVANNELSSSYSVRGGNFDENLVMVNGIQVYRPFLISNGQQEGLSFVVPDFVEKVNFYSGAWQAKYGGKLSSVLEIKYKKPDSLFLKAEAGFLGGSAALGIGNPNSSVMFSVRHKNSKYLLNSLETEGEYFPVFTDVQLLASSKLSDQNEVEFLYSFANNRYRVQPENRTTNFGTFNQSLRLFVAFDGQEIMNYNTHQAGLSLKHRFENNWEGKLTLSAVRSAEDEYKDVEGAYRLCDVEKNTDSSNFDECINIRGIGTNYMNIRNELEYLNLTGKFEMVRIKNDQISEWGAELSDNGFDYDAESYAFVDSADYISQLRYAAGKVSFHNKIASAYSQHEKKLGKNEFFRAGIKVIYPLSSKEVLLAPRIQYSRPVYLSISPVIMTVALGIHHQPAQLREMITTGGSIDKTVKSQSGAQLVFGMDQNFQIRDRQFNLKGEVFGKYFWRTIPYEVDNVRIVYLNQFNAKAYVWGADARFGGEFIPDTESWFTLGFLVAKEKLTEVNDIFVRRPSDQRITAGIHFEDHFPKNPDMRVGVHFQFGSGLPFGPPEHPENRTGFRGKMYRRLDLSFIRDFEFRGHDLSLSIEVLNVLGVENTITYNWIQDYSGQYIGVPNNLSARYFNLKAGFRL